MSQFYIKELNSQGHLSEVAKFIENIDLTTGRYIVSIKRIFKKRTINQNNLYWIWLTCLSETSETGNTKDEWHEILLNKFAPKKVIEFRNDLFLVMIRTSAMNKLQMTEYLEKVKIFVENDLNIILPMPEDKDFELLIEKYSYL